MARDITYSLLYSSVIQKSYMGLIGPKSWLAGLCSFLEAPGENLLSYLFQLLETIYLLSSPHDPCPPCSEAATAGRVLPT